MSWIMPFPEKATTDEYGTLSAYRKKNKMQAHSGTDWSPAGSNKGKTAIPAVANGTIKLVQWSNILGWVVVQSAMDKDKQLWYIGYCHVKCNKCGITCKGNHGAELALSVKVGEKIKAGETIAFIGNTGSASSGAHLHATASKKLKGVFGVTADKVDLKKLIKANSGPAKPKVAPAPKPAAPVVEEAPVVAQAVFHKVQPNETLVRIAAQYGTTVDKLVADNGIQNPDALQIGQLIRIEK